MTVSSQRLTRYLQRLLRNRDYYLVVFVVLWLGSIAAALALGVPMLLLCALAGAPAFVGILALLAAIPAVFVGLLQGGMGIVVALLSALGVGVPTGLPTIFFSGVTLLGAGYLLLRSRFSRRAILSPLVALMLLQAILVIIGVGWSASPHALNKAGQYLAFNFVSFTVALLLPASLRDQLYRLLLLVALVMSAGLLVSLFSPDFTSTSQRFGAFGIETISAGRLVGLGLLVAVYLPGRRNWTWFAWLLPAIGILVANSKGPQVAFLITILCIAGLGSVRFRGMARPLRALAVVGGLALVGLSMASMNLLEQRLLTNWLPSGSTRAEQQQSRSTLARIGFIRAATSDFLQSPIIGMGTDGYRGPIDPEVDSLPRSKIYPHNLTMEILSEYGLLGFSIYIVTLIWTVRSLITLTGVSKKALDFQSSGEAILLLALFLYTFINAHISASVPGNQSVWLVIGLIEAARRTPHLLRSFALRPTAPDRL